MQLKIINMSDVSLLCFLVEKNVISKDEKRIVEIQSKKRNVGVIDVLVEFDFINKNTLYKFIDIFNKNKKTLINDLIIDFNILKKVPYNFCINNKCLPVCINETKLVICMKKNNINICKEIERYVSFNDVDILEFDEIELLDKIEKSYTNVHNWLDFIEDNESVVKFVDRLLLDAISKRASDIHFSTDQNIVRVRYRIDGELIKVLIFHKDYYNKVLVRLKLMFSVDITSSFKNRDGSLQKVIFGERISFRIAFHNCIFGENIVIRILKNIEKINIDDLGYNEYVLNDIKKMINSNGGMIIFAGSTGSGKTTSMYVCTKEIDFQRNNVMSVEDPVECELKFIQQTDVNFHPEANFAKCLRSIMRQDPDVILIGEIRDAETALIAIRAAITGHKVITTIHAKDIRSVINRFIDFGIDYKMCMESISGIVMQRLVKKKCDKCNGKGCLICDRKGFFGRELQSESIVFEENNSKNDQIFIS